MPEPNRDQDQADLKNRPLTEKFRAAFAGIAAAWRRESNFRREAGCAIATVAALIVLQPALVWWALASLVIALVLALEMLNSALEVLIDRVHPDLHPEIKVVKDMAAGIVLLVAAAAAVVGVLLVAATLRGG